MSTTRKSLTFLALTFAITWGVVIAGWAAGLHTNPITSSALLASSMFGPSIAAFVCAMAFEKGRRAQALGLRFKPNLWWIAAWLTPALLAAGSVAFSITLGGLSYTDPAETVIAMAEQTAPGQGEPLRQVPYLGVILIVQALLLGALINSVILTFSEELGWRGYLYDLWSGAGFWRSSLATGAVWGVWHAPMILLIGHNYPDDRLLGAGLFVIFCVLLSPIIAFLRERGGSVVAAGIFHGAFNAVGGLTILALGNADFPWNGIVGIGGFAALAAGVAVIALLRQGKATNAAIP